MHIIIIFIGVTDIKSPCRENQSSCIKVGSTEDSDSRVEVLEIASNISLPDQTPFFNVLSFFHPDICTIALEPKCRVQVNGRLCESRTVLCHNSIIGLPIRGSNLFLDCAYYFPKLAIISSF